MKKFFKALWKVISFFFKTLWKIISLLFGNKLTGGLEKAYNDSTREFRGR